VNSVSSAYANVKTDKGNDDTAVFTAAATGKSSGRLPGGSLSTTRFCMLPD